MIGKTLAHYEITGLLGKGGMGEVFRGPYLQYRWHRQYEVLPDGEHFIMIENSNHLHFRLCFIFPTFGLATS